MYVRVFLGINKINSIPALLFWKIASCRRYIVWSYPPPLGVPLAQDTCIMKTSESVSPALRPPFRAQLFFKKVMLTMYCLRAGEALHSRSDTTNHPCHDFCTRTLREYAPPRKTCEKRISMEIIVERLDALVQERCDEDTRSTIRHYLNRLVCHECSKMPYWYADTACCFDSIGSLCLKPSGPHFKSGIENLKRMCRRVFDIVDSRDGGPCTHGHECLQFSDNGKRHREPPPGFKRKSPIKLGIPSSPAFDAWRAGTGSVRSECDDPFLYDDAETRFQLANEIVNHPSPCEYARFLGVCKQDQLEYQEFNGIFLF